MSQTQKSAAPTVLEKGPDSNWQIKEQREKSNADNYAS